MVVTCDFFEHETPVLPVKLYGLYDSFIFRAVKNVARHRYTSVRSILLFGHIRRMFNETCHTASTIRRSFQIGLKRTLFITTFECAKYLFKRVDATPASNRLCLLTVQVMYTTVIRAFITAFVIF